MPYEERQPTLINYLCIPVVTKVTKKRLFGGHYLRFGDFLTVCSFLYESGAILGRARSDKLTTLAKIFPTDPDKENSFISGLQSVARERLEEYKKRFKKKPNSFHDLFYILELERSGLSPADTDFKTLRKALEQKASLEQFELDIKSSVLEGIGFGSCFPELTRKMYSNEDDLAISEKPTIISLEEREEVVLQMVAFYTSEYYPELLDPLDLHPWDLQKKIEKLKGEEREGTKEQHKKIWYDILRKSKGISKDIVEKFLIADNIDPLKFKENHDYYIMDRYGGHKPTPSCFHPWLDLPLAYPYWFASAYPDVVKYFSTIKEKEFMRLFEDMGVTKEDLKDFDNPKFIDKEGHFRVGILYKLKEHYKELHPSVKLECQ